MRPTGLVLVAGIAIVGLVLLAPGETPDRDPCAYHFEVCDWQRCASRWPLQARLELSSYQLMDDSRDAVRPSAQISALHGTGVSVLSLWPNIYFLPVHCSAALSRGLSAHHYQDQGLKIPATCSLAAAGTPRSSAQPAGPENHACAHCDLSTTAAASQRASSRAGTAASLLTPTLYTVSCTR